MRVYFACSSQNVRKYLPAYNRIRNVLASLGQDIVSDWIDRAFNRTNHSRLSHREKTDIHNEGIGAIGHSDFLVADVSFPSSSVGYQVGLALSKKIPVLCLYSGEFGDKEAPQVIRAINSPLLVISEYNTRNLKSIIRDFIKNLPTSKLVKFNFIATPQIAAYLDVGSKRKKISKSDFLREIVEKAMGSDRTKN